METKSADTEIISSNTNLTSTKNTYAVSLCYYGENAEPQLKMILLPIKAVSREEAISKAILKVEEVYGKEITSDRSLYMKTCIQLTLEYLLTGE